MCTTTVGRRTVFVLARQEEHDDGFVIAGGSALAIGVPVIPTLRDDQAGMNGYFTQLMQLSTRGSS